MFVYGVGNWIKILKRNRKMECIEKNKKKIGSKINKIKMNYKVLMNEIVINRN